MMVLGEMCVLSLIYISVAVCSSVQYVVDLLSASICYFLITRLIFFLILLLCWFSCVICSFYLLCILCFCIVLCIFLLLFITVYFLFLFKFTDHCHRMQAR